MLLCIYIYIHTCIWKETLHVSVPGLGELSWRVSLGWEHSPGECSWFWRILLAIGL